jgi:hypothetical protein
VRFKGGLTLLAVMALMAVGATSASAASTRAEYVAQVDPICQTAAGPARRALKRFLKDEGRLGKIAHPTKRQVRALVNPLARMLIRLGSIEAGVTSQIATVQPAPGDEAIVASWVQDRTQYSQLSVAGARKFRKLKVVAAARLLSQADTALLQGQQLIASFGFRYCT